MNLLWLMPWALASTGSDTLSPVVPAEDAAQAVRALVPDGVTLTPHTLDFAGGWRVRFAGEHAGWPIVGASLRVAASAKGPMRVSGSLPASFGPTGPLLTPEEALDLAARTLPDLVQEPHHTTLAWWGVRSPAPLAYRVPVLRDGAGPAPWDVWIDASSGQPLAILPAAHSSDALAYGSNPVRSDVERLTLPQQALFSEYGNPASCSATDPDPSALELAACEFIEKQAAPDANGNYLYVPRPEAARDPFAEVNAFVHTDRMGAWLDDRWGFRVAWAPIDVFVNFPLANAFFGDFDGDGRPDISFGHANGTDLAYDADVVYHELGHGVVGTLAPDLPFLQADTHGLDWVSGSINEGAADVFAMLLTHDPEVGEYAGRAFGYNRGIRELSEPRRCPDDLLGEVHADGEIFGALFWQLMQDPEVGDALAGELLMGSVALWGSDIDWPAVGRSLLETAGDLHESGAASDAALAAIRHHVDRAHLVECDRVDALALNSPRQLLLFNAGLFGDFERIVGNVQLALPVGTGPMELRVREASASDVLGWSAFVRFGAPVEHEVVSVDGFGLTVAIPRVYDEVIDGSGAGLVSQFDGSDTPVYVMFASRNVGLAPLDFQSIRITAEVDALPVPTEPRPPMRPRSTQNLGCQCASTTPPAPLAALFAVLLCARRRSHDD